MNELVALVEECAAIGDTESLYARVLMSFIREREALVRCELARQLDASVRDREHRARMRHFAKNAPLKQLLTMYAGGVAGRQNPHAICDSP